MSESLLLAGFIGFITGCFLTAVIFLIMLGVKAIQDEPSKAITVIFKILKDVNNRE